MKLALSTTFSGSTPRCSTTIFLTRSPISLIVQPRACSIGPDPRRTSHRWSFVSFAIAHSLDLAPPWPTRTGERRQAPHRQYTGFPHPAMVFFAHPPVVRLSYFESLDYKP